MGNAIAFSYGLLALVLLAALIAKWVPWQVKLALIGACAACTFYVAHALSSFEGWPTDQSLPERAEFLHAVVREPTPEDKGAIYVWVATATEPRAYRLPYTRKTHEATHRAGERVKQGRRVQLRREPRGTRDVSPIRFYDLPPPGADRKQ